tara:strand:- start:2921 stop:3226 length:306 start_codon:yes stop_codon:yes gene_type:complete
LSYPKIRTACKEDVIFNLIGRLQSRVNIVFFINKPSEISIKTTPNEGCLGPKFEGFRCRFCTNVVRVSAFSTPKIGVKRIGVIDLAGKPRPPKEPRKSGYE